MRVRAFALALALATAPLPALAAPSKADVARAAELKKRGDELVHASQFKEAIEAYDESFTLVPDPAILYNRGRALERLGEFIDAYDSLQRFSDTAPKDLKAKVPNLGTTMEEIAANIATVSVQCAVEGATVSIRGKQVGTTPLASPVRVNAGAATVEVAMEGYTTFQRETTLPGNETTNIEVELQKPVVKKPPPPATEPETAPPPPPEEKTSSGGWKVATFVSGGIGLASLGTGLVFFGLAMGEKGTVDARCPMKMCDPQGRAALDQAQTFATVSTVFVVVGAIGLATAATTLLVSPKSAPVQARVFIGPGFGGLGGTF